LRGDTLREKIRRYLLYIKLRLVRVNDSPKKVAAGFSLGVFLGVFPTFGIAIPLSYLLASLFHWNRASAMTGSLIMNPLTTPLFWSVSASLGALLFQADAERVLLMWREGDKLHSLSRGTLIYLSGNLLVSFVVSTFSYFFALWLINRYRKN
jgi:uncharacterized protein (DUF2062 family)